MDRHILQRKFHDITVTVLLEGTLELSTDWLFPKIPREQWKREVYSDEHSKVLSSMNLFLIEYGDRKVLCDTGLGEWMPARTIYDEYFSIKQRAPIDSLLDEVSVKAVDITDVVVTHTDFDHALGITKKNGETGQLRFPNATHWLHALEYQHVLETDQPDDRPSRAEIIAAEDSGNLRLSNDGTPITEGFVLRHTPGHSPGHQVLEVSLDAQYLVFSGDLFHHPAHIHHPDWCPGQADKIALIQSREKIISTCIEKKGIIFTAHFPFPGVGKIVVEDSEEKWLPL